MRSKIKSLKRLLWFLGCLAILGSGTVQNQYSHAAIQLGKPHPAAGNKTGNYISEGFFRGGDRSVTSVKLKNIRRAKSGKAADAYERIVLDLTPNADNKAMVPYFQVQHAPQENRFVVSIWADVAYDFDRTTVRRAFAKSTHVKKLNIVPRVEDGLSVVEFVTHASKGRKPKVEVFQLNQPPRIIVDIL
ncbi:MAG: hypothetical protein AB1540_13695 [Bdellovibrionota bacterium]